MQRNHDYGGETGLKNQLQRLAEISVLGSQPKPPNPLTNPYSKDQDIDQRARAYLHVNCSVCHVESGGGNAKMELRLGTGKQKMSVFAARPQHSTFGIVAALLSVRVPDYDGDSRTVSFPLFLQE